MSRRVTTSVIAIACTLTAGQLAAATINITAGASPNIRNASANTAHNSPTETFAGRLVPNSWIRGLLDFDLSAIPDNATITSVTLDLTINSVDGTSASGGVGADGIRIFDLTESFNTSASGVTYNERDNPGNISWTTPGGTFNATPVSIIAAPTGPDAVTIGEVFSFASTAEFVSAVESDLASDQFQLIVRTPSIESSFNSRKIYRFGAASNANRAPVLTVEFSTVPEPSSYLLAMMALLGLAFYYRRYRRQSA